MLSIGEGANQWLEVLRIMYLVIIGGRSVLVIRQADENLVVCKIFKIL